MPFAKILQEIAEEADRTTLSAMAEKYPSLKNFIAAGELGEQYGELGKKVAPLSARLEALKYKDFEPALIELENWRNWKGQYFDEQAGMTKEEKRAKDLVAQMTLKVRELEARGDAEVTPEEIRAIVQETIKAADITANPNALAAIEARVEARLTKALGQDGEIYKLVDGTQRGLSTRFEDVYAKLTPKIRQHEKDFDEILDPTTVFEHMKKTGETDPIKAYNEMVAPRLREKETKDWEARLAKAKEDGANEARQSFQQSVAGRAVPVDSGGTRVMGALERRVLERSKPKEGQNPPGVKLGQGRIASHAAQEFRNKEATAAAGAA